MWSLRSVYVEFAFPLPFPFCFPHCRLDLFGDVDAASSSGVQETDSTRLLDNAVLSERQRQMLEGG